MGFRIIFRPKDIDQEDFEPIIDSEKLKELSNYVSKEYIPMDEAEFMVDDSFTRGFELGLKESSNIKIQNIRFNPPATIIDWSDGTKTVVNDCNYNDALKKNIDLEKVWKFNGIAHAIAKKFLPSYRTISRKFIK